MRIDRIAGLAAFLLVAIPGLVRADIRLSEAEAKQAASVKPLPEYPAMARQLKLTGKVELELTISVDGNVEDVKILSGNPVLTKPCAKVAAEWKFHPIRQDGKPSRATAPLTFEFK